MFSRDEHEIFRLSQSLELEYALVWLNYPDNQLLDVNISVL